MYTRTRTTIDLYKNQLQRYTKEYVQKYKDNYSHYQTHNISDDDERISDQCLLNELLIHKQKETEHKIRQLYKKLSSRNKHQQQQLRINKTNEIEKIQHDRLLPSEEIKNFIIQHHHQRRKDEKYKEDHEPNKKVHNFTGILDTETLKYLEKGANYTPIVTKKHNNTTQYTNNINNLIKKLGHSSNFNLAYHNLSLTQEILNTTNTIFPTPELHNQTQTTDKQYQQNTLKHAINISTHPDYIINIADKNLGLTINTTDWYRNTYIKMINDPTTYTTCTDINIGNIQEITTEAHNKATKLITDINHTLNTKYKLTNKPKDYITPQLNLNPKVHKLTSPATPHNEHLLKARPIVNSHTWVTTEINKIADKLFKELNEHINQNFTLINRTPTTLKSSTELTIQLQNSKLPQLPADSHTFLFTYDFSSLYTNIKDTHIDELLKTATKTYNFPINKCNILHNINQFNKQYSIFTIGHNTFHKQTDGLSMGCLYAQSCADAILSHYEYLFFTNTTHQTTFPTLRRYIDDGFGIIHCTPKNLPLHINTLKKAYPPNLYLDFIINPFTINYLDLTIYIGPNNHNQHTLDYRIYSKPYNAYTYIHYTSDCPDQYKTGLINTEHTRYKRLSTTHTEYRHTKHLFHTRLYRAGYPRQYINKTILKYKRKKTQTKDDNRQYKKIYIRIPYSKQYNTSYHYTIKAFKKYRQHNIQIIPIHTTNKKLREHLLTKAKLHSKL